MTYHILTKEELVIILEQHAIWLLDNTKGACADLSFVDLSSANLSFVDLSSANLSFANLSFANLSFANLRSADLSSADLSSANLSSADLSSANLRFANISSTDLLIFQYQRQTAYFTMDGTMRIGCISLPITEWADTYTHIGAANFYSKKEIEVYGNFIQLCLKMFKESK